jgi:hypothetical protein
MTHSSNQHQQLRSQRKRSPVYRNGGSPRPASDLSPMWAAQRVWSARVAVPDTSSNGGSSSGASGWDVLVPIISTLATGLGIVGFVTFFGGAVIWTRADAIGLPAFETVGLLPTSVLITTGAHFLVAALLIALGAVAVLYVYRIVVEVPFQAKTSAEADVLALQLEAARSSRTSAEAKATEAQRKLGIAQDEQRRHQQALQSAQLSRDDTASIEASLQLADVSVKESVTARDSAVQEQKQASDIVDTLTSRQDTDARGANLRLRQRRLATVAVSGLLLLVLELGVILGFVGIGIPAYVTLIVISVVTTALSAAVYASTQKFFWFGVAAFFSVSLFIGASTYFRTHDNPKAEPAAALVSSIKAVAGYFVAQTSDRVYFGEPPGSGLPARLVALDRAQVSVLSIGPLTTTEGSRAIDAAQAMASAICRQVPAKKHGTKTLAGPCPAPSGVAGLY